ncbi:MULTISPECIES: methyltransferase domain-containing protein [unclassified Saccharothrix]|uniref:methyltransferase domain-containing protein n=1 Tax=unclassified Saccharothrix TaxID=2593673 RepID=UPI00307CFF8F
MYPIRPGRLSTSGHPEGVAEVERWTEAGVDIVVCALTDDEIAELGLEDAPEAARDHRRLPIPDFGVPADLDDDLHRLAADLRAGRHVLVHCWGGIGRSSLLAAALLVLDGADPAGAWQAIAEARGRDVPETDEQRAWLDAFAARHFWDAQAESFDDEPDHGLRDPSTRRAWADLLLPFIPERSTVADLGCGTGSLSVLLAEAGHDVHGLDFSQRMVERATAKGSGAVFTRGDAALPPYAEASMDVVLARHVLWALPDPAVALARWVRLLKPGGRLVLVEGRWHTGAGLTAAETQALVRQHRADVEVRRLDDPLLWGGPITDERYLVVA